MKQRVTPKEGEEALPVLEARALCWFVSEASKADEILASFGQNVQ